MSTSKPDPKPGQWVHILAKVVDGDRHSGDVVVRIESHNEGYHCHVRRTNIVDTVNPPLPSEPDDLAIVVVAGGAYQRNATDWYAAGSEEPTTWQQIVSEAWAAGQDQPEVVWEP